MSVIRNMFGPTRPKSRFARSSLVARLIMFARPRRRFGRPLMRCSRMIARTSFFVGHVVVRVSEFGLDSSPLVGPS
jgi:hypothetical protein